MYTYDSLTKATNDLKKRGYTVDFNLMENCLICNTGKYDVDDFEIMEFYRFEGDSNPSDSSIVYGIQSKDGTKGVLVTGYGISAEGMSAEMAKKLSFRKN